MTDYKSAAVYMEDANNNMIKTMVDTGDYVEGLVSLRIRFTQKDIEHLFTCAAEFSRSRNHPWIRGVQPIPGSIGFTIDAIVHGQSLNYFFSPVILMRGLRALARASEKDLPMSWQYRHWICAKFLEPWEAQELGTRTACDLIYWCVKLQHEITRLDPRPPS